MQEKSLKVDKIQAIEILDSRGYPTISCRLELSDGSYGLANVPSGASTGTFEACELRDQDYDRYLGKGVIRARDHIHQIIAPELCGKSWLSQEAVDKRICDLDGSENKSTLGANAILAVSLAFARAQASAHKLALYHWLNSSAATLPVPLMNVINGGRHAHNNLAIQEFMIMPHGFTHFSQAIRAGAEITHALGKRFTCGRRGDEGGFAPELENPRQAIEHIIAAIEQAGYSTQQVGIALDMASSEFYHAGAYYIDKQGNDARKGDDWVGFIKELCDDYPIVSIEDPAHEDDWDIWTRITQNVGDKVQIVGDDLFVTQLSRLKQGVRKNSANAILIKPNQVGTLTEVKQALQYARRSSYNTVISHRSGETEDAMIADLAVGLGINQIKTGPTRQSDRVSKYNRLLWIEHELGNSAHFSGSQALSLEQVVC